jgi:DNA-binding transcriptional regulator YiaG
VRKRSKACQRRIGVPGAEPPVELRAIRRSWPCAQDAIALFRKKYGLLSGGEIRAIREHHSLTQVELARLLRLGPNTISRRESARNVQTAALDVLLRLLCDLPGSLDYLRDHAA